MQIFPWMSWFSPVIREQPADHRGEAPANSLVRPLSSAMRKNPSQAHMLPQKEQGKLHRVSGALQQAVGELPQPSGGRGAEEHAI